MSLRAGELNRLVRIEKRVPGRDAAGQPLDTWELVGDIWAGIANETGLGAIRSSLQGGVPTSIARYSLLVRYETANAMGIDAGMRAAHEDLTFEIKGLVRDLKHREKAYLLCEQGGSMG